MSGAAIEDTLYTHVARRPGSVHTPDELPQESHILNTLLQGGPSYVPLFIRSRRERRVRIRTARNVISPCAICIRVEDISASLAFVHTTRQINVAHGTRHDDAFSRAIVFELMAATRTQTRALSFALCAT